MIDDEILIKIFTDKITINIETGCWEWTGELTRKGYGRFYNGGRRFRAHRYSWEIFCEEPIGSLHVLHRCDNRKCCRPDHLWLGSNMDNVIDMVEKKRNITPIKLGENNSRSTLSNQQVSYIKKELQRGASCVALSGEFNVSRRVIRDIKSGRCWNHIN